MVRAKASRIGTASSVIAALAGLAGTPAGASQEPGPDLQVRVAFAPAFARQSSWSFQFECAVAKANPLLEAAIGRRLVVRDRTPWLVPAGVEEPRALRARLIDSVEHGGADLVVGLVPVRVPAAGVTLRFVEDGLAGYSQGYILLRVGLDLCASGALLAHEVAHVFGGIHRDGGGNLMDRDAPGDRVDPLNAALFALHRDRMIRRQAPPLSGTDLRMMWRLSRADVGSASTWLRVGFLAARMGKHEAACLHYEQALALDPELRAAWVNVGHARLALGHMEPAARAYERALQLDPDDGVVHNNLAVIYLSTGQPARAAAAIQRALALGYDVPKPLRLAAAKLGGGGG
jgi:hypothetical protein